MVLHDNVAITKGRWKMTIRDLQYAIQDAIDRGVPDDAKVEAGWDNELSTVIYAVKRDILGRVVLKEKLEV